MKILHLPPSLLLIAFSHSTLLVAATPTTTENKRPLEPPPDQSTATGTVVSTGDGPSWARSCFNAIQSWSSVSEEWFLSSTKLSTTTVPVGGISYRQTTQYVNQTTLCDGFPRLTYSPGIEITTGWQTLGANATTSTISVDTVWTGTYPDFPQCTIKPKDCDPLWAEYSSNVSAAATITPAPAIPTPPCMNVTADLSWSSVMDDTYGCGACTIYGDGVELVYFPPTSASRDMCASTQSGTLTSYGKGAVLEAYYGTEYRGNGTVNPDVQTAVVDGHTFTSGTAYISIATVRAVDRCSKTYGTPIKNAILAMPSESVLSLRYSQDHFQRLMSTDKITGYPVSYADFSTPIPWSAWAAQVSCGSGPQDSQPCNVIYENSFRPQLAIPPEITSLSPDFESCQMWYNGLWDPPLALTEYKSAARPTLPSGGEIPQKTSEPAAPSSAVPAPTSYATALPNERSSSQSQQPSKSSNDNDKPSRPASGSSLPHSRPNSGSRDSPASTNDQVSPTSDSQPAGTHNEPKPTGDDSPGSSARPGGTASGGTSSKGNSEHAPGSVNTYVPSAEPWTKQTTINGRQRIITGRNRQAIIGTVTCDVNGPAQTLGDGTVCSYGDSGLVIEVRTTVVFDQGYATATPQPTASSGSSEEVYGEPVTAPNHVSAPGATVVGDADTVTVTIGGSVETIVQSEDGGPITIDGSLTITPGGDASTLPNGQVVSAGPEGLVYGSSTTLGVGPTSSGDISSAIRSGLGYGDEGTPSATGSQPNTTGAASLASFEAFNIAAVIAIMVAAVAV